MNEKRQLNYVGMLIALTAAIGGYVVEHLAALNLPPHIVPIVQIAALVIVAITGCLQKKYALPTDYGFKAMIASVPPDGIAQFIEYLNGLQSAQELTRKQTELESKKRQAQQIVEDAKRRASAVMSGVSVSVQDSIKTAGG